MRLRSLLLAGGCGLWSATVALAGSGSVAVSPGLTSKLVLIDETCPTFSWGSVEGASRHDLVVYRLGEEGGEARPVLRRSFAGSVSGWTPSLESCLDRGGRYAWSVRAVAAGRTTEWSAPSMFGVAEAPSAAELEAALRVVRGYLEAVSTEGLERPTAPRSVPPGPSTPGDSSPVPRESSPAPRAVGTTQLSVDGGVEATAFIGDGASLTSLDPANLSAGTAAIDISGTAAIASDLVGGACVSEAELTFDPATQAELATHAGLPHAHHTQTVDTDTTCHGAACDGTSFSNVTAVAGDSATGFFPTGRIEEERVDEALARDSEVPGLLGCGTHHLPTKMRYIDCGNGTVLDTLTGILWLEDASCADLFGTDASGRADRDGAIAAAAQLADGTCGLTDNSSVGDWRLPEDGEWLSWLDDARALGCTASGGASPPSVTDMTGTRCHAAGPSSFTDVQAAYYWTPQIHPGDGEHPEDVLGFAVDLNAGVQQTPDKTSLAYVWPVRGGQ